MKPLGKVRIKWSPEFAYAIGLITSDGNVSPDGRHIIFTSKDEDLARTFQYCLGLTGTLGRKSGGYTGEKKYFVAQFSDVLFYRFLLSIGVFPNKSLTLGEVDIPTEYFFDFVRGHFDGDGCFYSYWDKRWRSSFMFYTTFVSASYDFVTWLRQSIAQHASIRGHVDSKLVNRSWYQLKYAKSDSLVLLRRMYHNAYVPHLERKRLKIQAALAIIGERL